MAKQKKRKKRVQKPRLSKKDRGLYALVFFPCIIVVLLSLQSVTRFSVFLLRMLYGTETLYAELDFGAWLVLALISFFVFGISGVIMHEYAISLRIPFREYFGGKNEKAKKQRKKFLLSFVVLALMTVGLFYASAQSCVIASPEAVTHYRCTEPDEVLFDYDKVDSVHISLEERNFRMVGGFVVSRHGYDLVLRGFRRSRYIRICRGWLCGRLCAHRNLFG